MLLELLPHFARLMPMADKYLSTRSASDKAQEAALAALGDDVRGSLRHITEEHEGICAQLQEQSQQTAQMAVDVARVRMGVESVEERVAKLEKVLGQMRALLVSVLVLMVAGTIFALASLFRARG